jgi:hypothetical protein
MLLSAELNNFLHDTGILDVPAVLRVEIFREGYDVILDFYHLQFRRPRLAGNPTFHDEQE